MNGSSLFLFLVALAVVWFAVWRSKQRKRPDRRDAAPTAPQALAKSKSDRAFAIGVATGAMGGSVKDAAAVNYAVDRAEQDGAKVDARDIGFTVAMEKEISEKLPD